VLLLIPPLDIRLARICIKLALSRNLTDVELHERMKQMIVREFCPNQRIPQDPLRAMVNRPGTVEQERYELGLQVRILDVFRVRQECNT
jgi:hypothetical protein